jgi:hypothetical protein
MDMFILLADGVVLRDLSDEFRPYAVGWFTLALINAGLAQSKNRSGLGWWLASLFIGPIATFLIVVLDRPSAQ